MRAVSTTDIFDAHDEWLSCRGSRQAVPWSHQTGHGSAMVTPDGEVVGHMRAEGFSMLRPKLGWSRSRWRRDETVLCGEWMG